MVAALLAKLGDEHWNVRESIMHTILEVAKHGKLSGTQEVQILIMKQMVYATKC